MNVKQNTDAFKYESISPITHYIEPRKQAARRHYGSHQFFTKRAWNVVQEYIQHFTQRGDVVCDPFGGSGVTAVEALVLERRPIYVDISPWATFLAKQVAIAPVKLGELETAFLKVKDSCHENINGFWQLSDKQIMKVSIKRWYPKNYALPQNADTALVEDLFSHRQLLALSEIWHQIKELQDLIVKDLLKYVFSATLYMCNRTFLSAKGRKASRGGSSIFSIYRYKLAKEPVELNVWEVFEGRFGRLLRCKKETNQEIGCYCEGSTPAIFITGQAQKLTDYVEPETVDYIFTDPPYGANIAYLDLTRMWDAWFGFEVSEEDRDAEAIEAGDIGHTPQDYKAIMRASISEMFKVLKYNRWMSLVFAHREPAIWDAIVKAAEAAGFEYVNTVCQPLSVVWSMHKKKNPLTVLSGELILNFRKVKTRKALVIATVGSGVVNLIKDSAELTIVDRNGAKTEDIYSDLIPKLLENGILGTVASEIGDITPLLSEEFDYDKDAKLWHPKPNKKLGCHIPLNQRIRFYVLDFLNRCVLLDKKATIDDIIFHVLPKLKNGEQPTEQHIIDEVRKIAVPYKGKYWVVPKDRRQYSFDFEKEPTLTIPEFGLLIQKDKADLDHTDIVYVLAKLGTAAGFSCHVGKKEQSTEYQGQPLSMLSSKTLRFLQGEPSHIRKAVEQIDVLWLDAGLPAIAFEVEHSTPFTTGLDRFIELLRIFPKMSGHIVLVAPKKRKRKLTQVLNVSHYIGAPMYMDRKVKYLWYGEVIAVCLRFCREQPRKSSVLEAIHQRLNAPELPF